MNFYKTKDIIFIINPNSGKKNAKEILNQLKENDRNFSRFLSNTYKEFEEFVNNNVQKYKIFIIVGGDGTINSSVDFFSNYPDKILAILPTGSGNGFANEMGYNRNIDSLIEDALKGETIDTDILEANGERFINIFGLGFDSYVAHDFSKRKNRGLKSYIISVIKIIFKFKPINVELISEEKKYIGKYSMVIVANTAQFGNKARIAPKAKPNNGYFELVLIKPFPFYYYPFFIVNLMTGKLKESRFIEFFRTNKEIIIKSTFRKHHLDGEPKINEGIVKIRILNQKQKFIKTKNCKL